MYFGCAPWPGYEFFENPTSSRPANAFGILIMVLILVSSVTLTIETLPALRESFKTGWWVQKN